MEFVSKVIHGSKHGRSIGYPTVNIEINKSLKSCLKRQGVYAVKVIIDNEHYTGVLFWGVRSLFDEKNPVCEILLLDFDGDLYGKKVAVEVGKYLRGVASVKNEKELRNLIEDDIQKVRLLIDNRES